MLPFFSVWSQGDFGAYTGCAKIKELLPTELAVTQLV